MRVGNVKQLEGATIGLDGIQVQMRVLTCPVKSLSLFTELDVSRSGLRTRQS